MSPVEILPPAYLESRLAAEAAKRRIQEEKELAVQSHKIVENETRHKATSQDMTKPSVQRGIYLQPVEKLRSPHLTHAMLQRPTLSRPASSGFLGNVYQGFVRAACSAPASQHGSAATTPTVEKAEPNMRTLTDTDKILAEKKRDADICAMPAWYH